MQFQRHIGIEKFLIIGMNFGHFVINPIFSNSMNEDAQTRSLRHPRGVFI